MKRFAALPALAGTLCIAAVPVSAAEQVTLIGRITVKASTSTAAVSRASTPPMTIEMPKQSGAPTSIVKKPDFTCTDLVVHISSVTGVALKTVTADELPNGTCHYQATFWRGFQDVINVKVDSPRFKVAGSTQVHLKAATKGGFTAGDVVAVRY